MDSSSSSDGAGSCCWGASPLASDDAAVLPSGARVELEVLLDSGTAAGCACAICGDGLIEDVLEGCETAGSGAFGTSFAIAGAGEGCFAGSTAFAG